MPKDLRPDVRKVDFARKIQTKKIGIAFQLHEKVRAARPSDKTIQRCNCQKMSPSPFPRQLRNRKGLTNTGMAFVTFWRGRFVIFDLGAR